MRRRQLPLLAVGLALLWLVAQAMASPGLAALVAVAALIGACALALRRRPGAALSAGLAVVALIVGGVLALLLCRPGQGVHGLLTQLALVVVLAPLVPLLYAATFVLPEGDDET
jgi:hypothetical protein